MAKFRYAILQNDLAETTTKTSGTHTEDLPESGILSELDVMMHMTPAYVNDTPLPPFIAIKKIEVLVNGSTVAKSLSGRQIKALMSYNKGPFSTAGWYHTSHAHNVYYHHFILYFGRFAGDTKYGLDLSKYANPQLKIEWDASQTSDSGATFDAAASPAVVWNIMCKLLDGVPVGFTDKYVQSRQINSWTVAASSEKPTEIPRGYPLFRVIVGARYKNVNWFDLINHIKLDFDNGKWLPIDMDYENVKAFQMSAFPGGCEIRQAYYGASGDDIDTQLMEINSHTSGGTDADHAATYYGFTTYGISSLLMYTEAGVAQGTASFIWIRDGGWGPMQTVCLPMSELLDGDEIAVNTTDFGRIDLKVETSASSGTSASTQVVAEYIKPNGE